MAIKYLDAKRIRCLSSDTLPTNVPVGTIADRTDKYNSRWWDGTNWLPNYATDQDLPIWGSHAYIGGGTGAIGSTPSNGGIQELQLDANATSIVKADLTVPTSRGASAQTFTTLVLMGGNNGGGVENVKNSIQDFTFSTTTNSNDRADLKNAKSQCLTKCYNLTHAFIMGGNETYNSDYRREIESYEFGTATQAVDTGNLGLTTETGNNGGWTDGTYAYSVGGGEPYTGDRIEQYQMGTSSDAIVKADQAQGRALSACPQTNVLGISMGGYDGTHRTRVEEYTFNSSTNAIEKGTNILPHQVTTGGSSQTSTYGYAIGGGEHQTDVTEYEFGTTTASNTDKGTLVTTANNWNAGGAGSP